MTNIYAFGEGWSIPDPLESKLNSVVAEWVAQNPVTDPGTLSRVSSLESTSKSTGDQVSQLLGKAPSVVNVRDYGVRGDGSTDDTPALTAALAAASKAALPLWIPAGLTMAISQVFLVPENMVVYTNGSAFRALQETGGFMVQLSAGSKVFGGITLQIPTGLVNLRGVMVGPGNNISVDSIAVLPEAEGTGVGNTRNNGVAMTNATSVRIGSIMVKNFENATRMENCNGVRIDDLQVVTYRLGMYITNSKNVSIRDGWIRGRSAASTGGPGDNGLLIDSTEHGGTCDVSVHMVVEDSAEHGYRIGGNKIVRSVKYDRCTARNTGASGFKALGGTISDGNYHEDIAYSNCTVIDAGKNDNLSGNQCGVMVQMCVRCTITDLNVFRVNKPYSAHTGIRVTGCTDVLVSNPVINGTFQSGVSFDSELGNQTNVKLSGGLINTSAGDGVRIQFTGCVFRRVNIIGETQIEAAGFALRVVNDGGGSVRSMPTVNFSTSSAQVATGVTGAYMGNIFAPMGDPASAQGFAAGSMWTDASGSGRYLRKGAQWVAM